MMLHHICNDHFYDTLLNQFKPSFTVYGAFTIRDDRNRGN